jgi:hypothetical protein
MFKKSFRNTEEFNSYLENNKTEFFDVIIDNIKKCIEDDLLIVKIADIELTEEDHRVNVSIEIESCSDTIELAKEHYIKTEQYEKCVELDDIIKKLNL